MTAKEYLSQAFRIDQRIESKMQQIQSLEDMAVSCTSNLSGMPRNPSPSVSPMADAVCKIIDLENEIKQDLCRLVDLKREIIGAINAVDNIEYRMILEKRYICYITWEQIAVDMNYDLRWLYRLHNKALDKIVIPETQTRH